MKSILIASRKPKTQSAPSYPALYQNSATHEIAFASSATTGIIIHSEGKPESWGLGWQFNDGGRWDDSIAWHRVNEPVTIKFQP